MYIHTIQLKASLSLPLSLRISLSSSPLMLPPIYLRTSIPTDNRPGTIDYTPIQILLSAYVLLSLLGFVDGFAKYQKLT